MYELIGQGVSFSVVISPAFALLCIFVLDLILDFDFGIAYLKHFFLLVSFPNHRILYSLVTLPMCLLCRSFDHFLVFSNSSFLLLIFLWWSGTHCMGCKLFSWLDVEIEALTEVSVPYGSLRTRKRRYSILCSLSTRAVLTVVSACLLLCEFQLLLVSAVSVNSAIGYVERFC